MPFRPLLLSEKRTVAAGAIIQMPSATAFYPTEDVDGVTIHVDNTSAVARNLTVDFANEAGVILYSSASISVAAGTKKLIPVGPHVFGTDAICSELTAQMRVTLAAAGAGNDSLTVVARGA